MKKRIVEYFFISLFLLVLSGALSITAGMMDLSVCGENCRCGCRDITNSCCQAQEIPEQECECETSITDVPLFEQDFVLLNTDNSYSKQVKGSILYKSFKIPDLTNFRNNIPQSELLNKAPPGRDVISLTSSLLI